MGFFKIIFNLLLAVIALLFLFGIFTTVFDCTCINKLAPKVEFTGLSPMVIDNMTPSEYIKNKTGIGIGNEST